MVRAEEGHLDLLSEKKAFSILVDGVSPSIAEGREGEAMSEEDSLFEDWL